MTVGRSGGATFRVTNEASIDEFGVLSESLTLPLATDAQAFDRASWLLSTSSMPESRLPELGLDGLEPTSGAAVRQIDLAQRVAVTGMPSQAPASTFDLRVEGYSEKISAGGWEVTANTSPYNVANPFIVDDPVYGLLDSDNRIVF